MPSSREHIKAARRDLGYVHEWLHQFMDYPSSFYGSRHRKFFHDMKFVLMIKKLAGDNVAKEALHHMLLDMNIRVKTTLSVNKQRYKHA